MNDAAQRFNQGGFSRVKSRANNNRINGRDCDKFREATRQAGDSMLAIKLALMRITSAAVFANRLAPRAHAVQPLIDDDVITNFKVAYFASLVHHIAIDLVTQNLWLDIKRDRLAALINIIVGVSREDVCIRTADTGGGNPHQHVIWRNLRTRHITHLKTTDINQHRRLHSRGFSEGGESSIWDCQSVQ